MIDVDALFDQIMDILADDQIEKNDIYFSVVDGEPRLAVYEHRDE